jgi:hypothetical protein
MRVLYFLSLGIAVGLFLPAQLAAEELPTVTIDSVRLGFPQSGGKSLYRIGMWNPVYVSVTVQNGVLNKNAYTLVTETTDGDDLENEFPEQRLLPPIKPGDGSVTLVTYVRPGSAESEVTVSLRTTEGRVLASAKPSRESINACNLNVPLCLTTGTARLDSLRKALLKHTQLKAKDKPDLAEQDQPGGAFANEEEVIQFVHADRVAQLPARWFGYTALDLAVLGNGGSQITEQLLDDATSNTIERREALAEWVRRGGRLVVSCNSANQEFVKKLLTLMQFNQCEINGSVSIAKLPALETSLTRWRGIGKDIKETVTLTKLVPGPGAKTLLTASVGGDKDPEKRPVVVVAACGLGKVMLVACDFDQPVFSADTQELFWEAVGQEMNVRVPPSTKDSVSAKGFAGTSQNYRTELSSRWQDSMEVFDDVPVISFGWVALFIFLYILVVGPLDYLFLKKVVKRLELTWITFPAIVLVVSAAAYFSAYALKGEDLKINKVDVVDIDLREGQVYGSTWFTLFSPRIQNYTIGLEPSPQWTESQAGSPDVLIDAMGRAEGQMHGPGRLGTQGLFRHAYEYAPDGGGLKGVPVQVWATKSFTGAWRAPLKPDLLGKPDIQPVKDDPTSLTINWTGQLPVELHDVVLLLNGKAYTAPGRRMTPGIALTMTLARGGDSRNTDQWVRERLSTRLLRPAPGTTSSGGTAVNQPPSALIKSMLFFDKTDDANQIYNSGLRCLDQFWRQEEQPKEILLFGRVDPEGKEGHGPSETVTQKGLSPSRLWLGALPGTGQQRKELDGTMTQETYVRIYIPITP